MKRLILLLTIAALMIVISSLPALAKNSGTNEPPPTWTGNTGKSWNGGGAVYHADPGDGVVVYNKNSGGLCTRNACSN